MTKKLGFVVMLFSLALSQVACTEESNEDSADIGNENDSAEADDALSGNALQWANTCVSEISRYRRSKGLTAGTNIVSARTQAPRVSGATYGDCAVKEASYDSTHGAHAAHNANLYQCLGTQNECLNWGQAGDSGDQVVKKCVKAWFDEGPGGGHYTNMTSSRFTNITCGVYKNSAGKYSIAADFKLAY